MANEINLATSARVVNGNFSYDFKPGALNLDQNNPGRGGHVQKIGTSEEVVDIGDVSIEGYAFLRNLDSTNWIEYGPDSTGGGGSMVVFGKLKPGEVAVWRIGASVVVEIKAKADTAEVLLDVTVLED